MLRMSKRKIYSTYGPSADTGGLTIYAYPNLEALLEGEAAGVAKAPLPGPGDKPSPVCVQCTGRTERPAPVKRSAWMVTLMGYLLKK